MMTASAKIASAILILTAVPGAAAAAEMRLVCSISAKGPERTASAVRHYALDAATREMVIIIDGERRPVCGEKPCTRITAETIRMERETSSGSLRTVSSTTIDRLTGGLSETHETFRDERPLLRMVFAGECQRAGAPKF